jgi:hypothetical protein
MRPRCLLAALIAMAACGDSPPSTPLVDAPPVPIDTFDPSSCLISTNYGALGTKTGTPSQGASTLSVELDAGPPRDVFFLNLKAGNGVFAGGLANGTYPLTGTELSYSGCGLCVNIIADLVAMQGPSKLYFATGGSVTLTDTAPPTGSLQNVTLHEIGFDGVATGSGCTTTIASMTFGT